MNRTSRISRGEDVVMMGALRSHALGAFLAAFLAVVVVYLIIYAPWPFP